eukprot:Anaeramoba_flamelloidesa809097_93.p1 GENE.a809097_93~~a809097_93.p1  ORF type:complete len:104 (-),score=19.03 a809097_93:1095-1406(-)
MAKKRKEKRRKEKKRKDKKNTHKWRIQKQISNHEFSKILESNFKNVFIYIDKTCFQKIFQKKLIIKKYRPERRHSTLVTLEPKSSENSIFQTPESQKRVLFEL